MYSTLERHTIRVIAVIVKCCVIWSSSTLPPPGSVLLQQTDGHGQTALDLVTEANQRQELLQSAQVGDSALRNRTVLSELSNLPLLAVGSTLLAHLIFSYRQERGLSSFVQPSDRSHSLGYRLVRALEAHSLQKMNLGWTDKRAAMLVADVETLLELGRGRYTGQVAQAVKECKEENTVFLLEMVENLKSSGEALLADSWYKKENALTWI